MALAASTTTPVLILDEDEEEVRDAAEEILGQENTMIEQHPIDSTGTSSSSASATLRNEFQGYLEAWDDVGGLAISVGSKLVKRECGIIRKLCHDLDDRRRKRKFEEGSHDGDDDVTNEGTFSLDKKRCLDDQATVDVVRVDDKHLSQSENDQQDGDEKKGIIARVERMQRLARLVYNLEMTHRYMKSEMQALADGEIFPLEANATTTTGEMLLQDQEENDL